MLLKANIVHSNSAEAQRSWRQEFEWLVAWSRAEYHRCQESVLLPPALRNNPHAAAELLTTMEPTTASDMLAGLPPASRQAILTAVFDMQRHR
ncbi:hypothetical protein [Nocardia nova]|uniref:hypothetical protein n=1 Tax=Nocardia nova TaxID=37330 RepID=UPI00189422E5|nr:hypothetical protein [Nocardia nova]MBF6149570.1 hypothetical protein [Nocardia nova]